MTHKTFGGLFIVLTSVLSCIAYCEAYAQDTIHIPVWCTLDLGGGSEGFTGAAALTIATHNYLLTMETLDASNADVNEYFPTSDYNEYKAYRFNVGKMFPGKSSDQFLIASAGIAIAQYDYHHIRPGFIFSSDSIVARHMVGGTIDLKLVIPTYSAFGVNFSIKIDFNKVNTFYAFMIGLRIGRITHKKV